MASVVTISYTDMFPYQCVMLGRAGIVRHEIDVGEAGPIWQPHGHIPAPPLEEAVLSKR